MVSRLAQRLKRSMTYSSFPLRPPLPIPQGTSEEQLYRFLRSVRPDGARPTEIESYCKQDWRRFVYTWGLTHTLDGTCLELGANPYFTTHLLQQCSSLKLTLANYFAPGHKSIETQRVHYMDWATQQLTSHELEYYHFSVESEPFPFCDAAFDVVLFCEIIEHLQVDPIAVIREIKRILRHGGTLILTTPNVSRLENVARMVAGVNIYDPYSGYGPYGRHNREYNKHELYLLLTYCGFEIDSMFTADVHDNDAEQFCALDRLGPLLRHREYDLGQYIFVRCRNTADIGARRPSWLYRSYPEAELE